MASNKSTPKTVLKAPKVKLKWLHKNKGLNRALRRHGFLFIDPATQEMKYQPTKFFVPKSMQVPAVDKPYKKRTKKGK